MCMYIVYIINNRKKFIIQPYAGTHKTSLVANNIFANNPLAHIQQNLLANILFNFSGKWAIPYHIMVRYGIAVQRLYGKYASCIDYDYLCSHYV